MDNKSSKDLGDLAEELDNKTAIMELTVFAASGILLDYTGNRNYGNGLQYSFFELQDIVKEYCSKVKSTIKGYEETIKTMQAEINAAKANMDKKTISKK